MSKHLPKINCLKSWLWTIPKWQEKRQKREAAEIDKGKNNGRTSGRKEDE